MDRARSTLSWLCGLVMLLPTAPCARLGLPCPMAPARCLATQAAAAKHDCCQHRDTSQRPADTDLAGKNPCSGTCCIETATPGGPEKPAVEPLLVAGLAVGAVAV